MQTMTEMIFQTSVGKLFTHWPCITDLVVYPPTGSMDNCLGDQHGLLNQLTFKFASSSNQQTWLHKT